MNQNILFSGGAEGADSLFGECAEKIGHKVVHFGFEGMKLPSKIKEDNVCYLNDVMLKEADVYLKRANLKLERSFPTKTYYTNNLLRRNYFQVKKSMSVYAVAALDLEKNIVLGGTGWAVQMAVDIKIPEVYVFDLKTSKWFYYEYVEGKFHKMIDRPIKPTGYYTGIGSRPQNLTVEGIEAIRKLY